ncbi:MAG: hypothetical protein Alpg2KO_07370 [Alphaproteobacteria bacterium]
MASKTPRKIINRLKPRWERLRWGVNMASNNTVMDYASILSGESPRGLRVAINLAQNRASENP